MLAGKRKWNENLSMFETMCEKPLSLVPVCLPWQAPISPSGRTKFSLYYKNSFVDVFKRKKKKKNTKNNTHKKTLPWSRSFIINRVGAWKGICFDLVTKTKTKRLSLIAWMTQVGPSVKSNKSLLPSELYANTGPWAPACSSSRPHAMSLSLRKPG